MNTDKKEKDIEVVVLHGTVNYKGTRAEAGDVLKVSPTFYGCHKQRFEKVGAHEKRLANEAKSGKDALKELDKANAEIKALKEAAEANLAKIETLTGEKAKAEQVIAELSAENAKLNKPAKK